MQNSQKTIISAVIIAGVIIAGAILLKDAKPSPKAPAVNDISNFPGRAVSASDHILGSVSAQTIIVEYSDFECPFCKSFHNTMHQVVDDSNGQAAWVYRHYPIPQLHPKAAREAEASECAYEQGGNEAFWKYADRIFEITPSNNGLDEAELPKIADYIGLDAGVFVNCLTSGKFAAKVQADVEDGAKAGVNGTPSSFILKKGKVVGIIPGAMAYEAVMQKLGELK